MVKTGCFILQVALCSLGGLAPLGYPEDGNLGKDWNKEMIDQWVSSMFSINKQFPLFILQKLMEQSFFQAVLSRGKWKRPHDLARMVLYDSLVKPTLDLHGRRAATSFLGLIHRKKSGLAKEEPTLLHALWLTLTGPDLSGGVVKEGDNVWSTVRSATELREAGIGFGNNKEMGIRGIKFKTKWLKFDAYLCLPFISIGPNANTLLESLIDFEGKLYQDGSGGEVCAYLKFMSELVRSHEDAKVLAVHGIIDADTESGEKLHHTLAHLRLPEVVNNQNLCVVRDEIRGYVKPSKWDKIVNLIVITLLLTLVQTIYTVVDYHHPKN